MADGRSITTTTILAATLAFMGSAYSQAKSGKTGAFSTNTMVMLADDVYEVAKSPGYTIRTSKKCWKTAKPTS